MKVTYTALIMLGIILVRPGNSIAQTDTSTLFGTVNFLGENGVDYPSDIYPSDIDNDGDIDIISGRSSDTNRLLIHLNDGNGSFESIYIQDNLGGRSEDIHTADLDGDGYEDLISIESISDLRVYKNLKDGTYAYHSTLTTDLSLGKSVFSSDLNGDGYLDILAASFSDHKIVWFPNDGDGNFGQQDTVTLNETNITSVYASDLDNDGDNDIVSTSLRWGKVTWYKNDGIGNFSDSLNITAIEAVNQPSEVITSDIDSDGDFDILATSNFPGAVVLIENLGGGNFSQPNYLVEGASFAKEITTADFNNDGKLDIAYSATYDHGVMWIENLGDLNFTSPRQIDFKVRETESIIAADFNNDGRIDIATATPRSDLITWYENLNDTTFSDPIILASTTNSSPNAVKGFDHNKDGLNDIFVSSYETEELLYYKNLGSGTFDTPIDVLGGFPAPDNFEFSDVNGDGLSDLVTFSRTSYPSTRKAVSWFRSVKDSTFEFVEIVDSLSFSRSGTFNLADMNNDGYPDILINSFDDANIHLYKNEEGSFQPKELITDEYLAISELLVLDVNSDDKQDILAYSRENSKIHVFKNGGNASFPSFPDTTFSNISIDDYEIVDINNDSKLDLLISGNRSTSIYWEDKLNTLRADTISSLDGVFLFGISTGDFNNDQMLDLIALNNFGSIVYVENSQEGFLEPSLVQTSVTRVFGISAADVNGNNSPDILFFSTDNDQAGWIEDSNPLINSAEEVIATSPSKYTLFQNYPNPFNPSTTIKYALKEAARVQLKVYDLLGREVAFLIDDRQNAGFHTVKFDASALSSGVYIYRIEAGNFVQTKKLTLIK